jgi:hypothetical protein
MIDIFKSPTSGKIIIAIKADEAIHVVRSEDVAFISGPTEAIEVIRIALNSLHDGWTEEAVDKAAFRCTEEEKKQMESTPVKTQKPIDPDMRQWIRDRHDEGHMSREIARMSGISEARIRGVVGQYTKEKAAGLHVKPIIEGLQPAKPLVIPETKSPAESPQDEADDIIRQMKGRKYTSIAAEINRITGQIWLADDVSKRIAEMRADGSY